MQNLGLDAQTLKRGDILWCHGNFNVFPIVGADGDVPDRGQSGDYSGIIVRRDPEYFEPIVVDLWPGRAEHRHDPSNEG